MGRHTTLTENEKEYLRNPEEFMESRADSTIRKMNHDLRQKTMNARKEAYLIARFFRGKDMPEPEPGTILNPERKHGPKADVHYPAAGTESRHTLLTPTERKFLLDPEGYAEDHAPSTVSNMKRNLREKYKNWEDEWELLCETFRTWDRVNITSSSEARCRACGREEEGEEYEWEAIDYIERFPDWVTSHDYGVPSKMPPQPGRIVGFCPDCSHIHEKTVEMAVEEGKVPCYGDYRCDAGTHGLATQAFQDCWKRDHIWLNPDDMEALIEETNHIDDTTATQIRTLYR